MLSLQSYWLLQRNRRTLCEIYIDYTLRHPARQCTHQEGILTGQCTRSSASGFWSMMPVSQEVISRSQFSRRPAVFWIGRPTDMGRKLYRAHAALAQVKKTFGPHAGLLVINSKPMQTDGTMTTSPLAQVYIDSMNSLLHNDPFMRLGVLLTDNIVVKNVSLEVDRSHAVARLKQGFEDFSDMACRLTSEDVDAIRGFLREYVSQSLVPWMEARVREWNEIFVNSRRGITGRLFGAGRKLFGSGRSTPNQNLVYNSIRG